MKIKKGDQVQVIAGQDKGAKGEVKLAIPSKNKVVVEGVNLARKHQKPSQVNPDGGIIDIEKPIDVSNVKIVDKKAKKSEKKGAAKKPAAKKTAKKSKEAAE